MSSARVGLTPQQIAALPADQRKKLFKGVKSLHKKLVDDGPKTDEQLHAWIVENVGIDISRTKVCDDHDAPFDFLADLYFNRVDSALLMANRGGSKTFLVALLHYINATYKPGYEGLSFGATEAQGKRCYEHLTNWVYEIVDNREGGREQRLKNALVRSIEKITQWKNGSKVEIVPGTKKAVNGPHPQLAHADEVEQIDGEAWDESRNMAVSKRTKDGRELPAQDVLTSTRKSSHGRMQELLDRVEAAIRRGLKPPFRVYKWCTFETTAEQPHCQMAPRAEREARLAELGRDPCEMCDCHLVPGGTAEWEDGSTRTLDTVCQGRFFRSRGWRPLGEVQNTFQQNSIRVWEAQQECAKPSTEGNYVPWDEAKHEIDDFEPDPAQGDIYMAVDWGGTNPHAVNWYQVLRYDTVARKKNGEPVVLPEGAIVCFDEVYKAEISTGTLATLVKDREATWRAKYPRFRVKARFADPQGKASKLEFRDAGLKCSWPVGTRDFDYMVTKVQELFDPAPALFYCVYERCPKFVEEVVVWHADPKTGNQVDEFNHAMSNWRYAVANIDVMDRRESKRKISRAASGAKLAARSVGRKPGIRRGPLGFAGGRRRHPLNEFGGP